MNGRCTARGMIVALMWGVAVFAANADVVLSAQARAERDAKRLGDIARSAADQSQRRAADERRLNSQRAQLADLTEQIRELDERAQSLVRRAAAAGDDLDQAYAQIRTGLGETAVRIERGPLALDHTPLARRARQLAAAPPSVSGLYDSWYVLHEMWLAGAEIVEAPAPLTDHNGWRAERRLTRTGALALTHDGRSVLQDAASGFVLAPTGGPGPADGATFIRQLFVDSGAIGGALLVCLLAGLVSLYRARRGDDGAHRAVTLVCSASLLLGLLGTVVGLIHTFRGMARGGGDVAMAAAGIAHALATTCLALIIAIGLTLAHGLVRRRTGTDNEQAAARQTAASLPRARGRTTWPPVRRTLALASGLVLTCGLFFLMQWLTQRPLSDPPASERPPSPVRVDLSPRRTTPPPPAEQSAPPALPDLPASALPPLPMTPLPDAVPAPDLPPVSTAALANTIALSEGLGGSAVRVGTLWQPGAASDTFAGRDLVPISSARPRYPRAALASGVDGIVEAIFEIDADGRVGNVRILSSSPPGVFEGAAIAALEKWLYAPFYQNGRAVVREATQRLEFNHRDARETYLDDDG